MIQGDVIARNIKSESFTISSDIPMDNNIIQVVFGQTPATRQTIFSDELVEITGSDIVITPKSDNSIIFIRGIISSSATYVSSYGITKNGSTVVNFGSNNNVSGSLKTSYYFGVIATYIFAHEVSFMDYEIEKDVSYTYRLCAGSSWGGVAQTLYINDRDTNDMRGISTIMAMEIGEKVR